MDTRVVKMTQWLNTCETIKTEFCLPKLASEDASFRRYFRIYAKDNPQLSYIVMDAPTSKEDTKPFIKVAGQLLKLGIRVPKILAKNLSDGFLLLEDFGDITYFKELTNTKISEERIDKLYRVALDSLIKLQVTTKNGDGKLFKDSLALYDARLLQNEMDLFTQWFLTNHLQIQLNKIESLNWQKTCKYLIDNAMQKTDSYTLRDYHSRNLMLLNSDNNSINVGILDFQDACRGNLTYDAVSLLRDCYLSWPDEQVEEWQKYVFSGLCQQKILVKNEWQDFQKNMDLMGIQRHLKAIGIFSRLYHRDGKTGYLDDIPNTLNHIILVAKKYHEMKDLMKLIDDRILPNIGVF